MAYEGINNKFLNRDSLKALIAQIKAADDAALLAAEKLIGTKDASGTAVAMKIGGTSYTNLKNYVDALDVAMDARMNNVEAEVVEFLTDTTTTLGTIKQYIDAETAARVAQVGELGNKTEAQGTKGEDGYVAPVAHTVKSYVDAKVAASTTAADDAIKALDSTVSSDETTNFTAYKPAEGETAAVPAVGADVKVAVTVKQEDGKLKSVSVSTSDIASAALLNQEIAKRQEAIAALGATVYGSMTADGAVREGQKVGVKIVEEDGKLTSVTVATQDIASADALSKLQAVVGYSELATGENAGQVGKSVKTRLEDAESAITLLNADSETEGSVDYKVAEAVAGILDDAPEAYDTLKEIASWIGTGDVANTTAATMLADITKLKGADTVEGSVANSIKVLKESLYATVESATSTADVPVRVTVTQTDGVLTAVTATMVAFSKDDIDAIWDETAAKA